MCCSDMTHLKGIQTEIIFAVNQKLYTTTAFTNLHVLLNFLKF